MDPTLRNTGLAPRGSAPNEAHERDSDDDRSVDPGSASPGISFSPTCASYGMVRQMAFGGGGHGEDVPMSEPVGTGGAGAG